MNSHPSPTKLGSMIKLAWLALEKNSGKSPDQFRPLSDVYPDGNWRPDLSDHDCKKMRERFSVEFQTLVEVPFGQVKYQAIATTMGSIFVTDGTLTGTRKEVERLVVLELASEVGKFVSRLISVSNKEKTVSYGNYKLNELVPTLRHTKVNMDMVSTRTGGFAPFYEHVTGTQPVPPVDHSKAIKDLETKLAICEMNLMHSRATNDRLTAALKKIIVVCEEQVWQMKGLVG